MCPLSVMFYFEVAGKLFQTIVMAYFLFEPMFILVCFAIVCVFCLTSIALFVVIHNELIHSQN